MTGECNSIHSLPLSHFNMQLLLLMWYLVPYLTVYTIHLSPAGLDVVKEHILEMACIITDEDLNIVAEVHNELSIAVPLPGMKITVGHWPKFAYIARLATHFTQRSVLWPDKRCACTCNNQIITTYKKCWVIKMVNGYKRSQVKHSQLLDRATARKGSDRKTNVEGDVPHVATHLMRGSISLWCGYVLICKSIASTRTL